MLSKVYKGFCLLLNLGTLFSLSGTILQKMGCWHDCLKRLPFWKTLQLFSFGLQGRPILGKGDLSPRSDPGGRLLPLQHVFGDAHVLESSPRLRRVDLGGLWVLFKALILYDTPTGLFPSEREPFQIAFPFNNYNGNLVL